MKYTEEEMLKAKTLTDEWANKVSVGNILYESLEREISHRPSWGVEKSETIKRGIYNTPTLNFNTIQGISDTKKQLGTFDNSVDFLNENFPLIGK